MWTTLSGVLAVAALAVTSLLTGAYMDLIVEKTSLTSLANAIDAFHVHFDFARSEKWRGYFVDQERSGEWTVHNEVLDLTSFFKSNRIIGSATDPKNLPPWDITGYVKSDSKFLTFTGPDVGAGMYLLKAYTGGLRSKPSFGNTFFRGFLFGWNTNEKGEVKFRRCPLILIRDVDVQTFSISAEDVREMLRPQICDDLQFPNLEPEKP